MDVDRTINIAGGHTSWKISILVTCFSGFSQKKKWKINNQVGLTRASKKISSDSCLGSKRIFLSLQLQSSNFIICLQKQSPRGIFTKMCFEKMQQI